MDIRGGDRRSGDAGIKNEAQSEPFEVAAQPAGDLGIRKSQQALAPIHQRDLNTQGGKDAGILRADHPAADDGHAPGNADHFKDRVRVVDALVIERHLRRMIGG